MFGNRMLEQWKVAEQKREEERLIMERARKFGLGNKNSDQKYPLNPEEDLRLSTSRTTSSERFIFGQEILRTPDDTVHESLALSPIRKNNSKRRKPVRYPYSYRPKYPHRPRTPRKKNLMKPQQKEVDPQEVREFFEKAMGRPFDSNFAPRRQPDYLDSSIQILHNTLHVYGTDMMDTSSVLRYFAFFNPKSIVVVDASSVNVEFDSSKVARRALFKNMRNPPPAKEVDNTDDFDPFEPQVPPSDMLWYELIPHVIFKIQRKLFARYATNKDKKSKEAENDQMFSKFIKIKKYLQMGGIINKSPKQKKNPRDRSNSVSQDHSQYSIIDEDLEYMGILDQMKNKKKVKKN